MIEVPAAAIAARAIAAVSDFVSLGTNDLTMYTLAVDRGDENVASLYDPLHPAVLRLIRMTIEAAEKAGIPVGLCGEMAGDARYTPLLLGLGLRDLSMPAVGLPRVKRRVRAIDMAKATRGAHLILEQPDLETDLGAARLPRDLTGLPDRHPRYIHTCRFLYAFCPARVFS